METGKQSDTNSVPKLDDLLDMISGAQVFSKTEIMNPEVNGFKTEEGLYEWLVTPDSICNAASALMRLTNRVFQPFIGKFVVVYCADVLIFSKEFDAHADHVRAAFQLVMENGLRLNPNKSVFGCTKMEFLGFIVSANGIQVDLTKVHAITNRPIPKTLAEVTRFNGLVAYYKRFIKNFSVIMAPITECLRSNSCFTWNSQAEECFKEIVDKIFRAPILSLPDLSKTFLVDFDANEVGIWAALSQEGRLIAYFSKLLNGSKENYSVCDLKLYAVVQALKFWKNYLIPKEFILRIDSEVLCFHNSQKNSDMKHSKWATFLLDYKIQMSIKAGSQSAQNTTTDPVGNQREKKHIGRIYED